MPDARRIAAILMAAFALTALAACTDDITDEGPGPVYDTGPPGSEISDEVEATLGPKMTITFDITGAVAFTGTTTGYAPSADRKPWKTCADYVKGSADQEYLAPGEYDGPAGNQSVALDMRIAGYAGPGSYPRKQLIASQTRPTIAIEDTVYGTRENSTGQVTVDGKGGGSWTFTKLVNRLEGSSPDDAISGTITWKCQDR
ncbi:hypothetical protein [Paractinoplanes lichenicola]|uniref:Lipoprotein n=1 Tax=Paractinoplanes lichenicola TaxID=2802976 RepID=A0ABS1W0P9_9ACTN|nr:hypothetical protein [Actinoplanes lichenicola]MBL7260302.1 hypothetical protein [Actinoplanes lichenicola]